MRVGRLGQGDLGDGGRDGHLGEAGRRWGFERGSRRDGVDIGEGGRVLARRRSDGRARLISAREETHGGGRGFCSTLNTYRSVLTVDKTIHEDRCFRAVK